MERVVIAERELINTAIERFADKAGQMGDLARLVIIRRAEVGKDAGNV